MIALEYKTSREKSWPLEAQSEGGQLIFSGNFSVERVEREKSKKLFNRCIGILLWAFIIFGILCFVLNTFFAWQINDFYFLLRPSALNLSLFIGIFAALYLWAMTKQQELSTKGLNLLHFRENSSSLKEKTIDVFEFFSPGARDAWNNAVLMAQKRSTKTNSLSKNEAEATANDLALALLEDKSIQMVFFRLGVDTSDIKILLKNYSIFYDHGARAAVEKNPFVAFAEAAKLHNKNIDPLMLLCALAICLPEEHILKAIFFNIDLSIEKLENIASWIFNLKLLGEDLNLFHKLSKYKPDNEINRGLTAVPTFYLDRFSKDLTFCAKYCALPLALGRGADLHEILKLLSSGSQNLIIKGEGGTGRTTLINELAYKMATDQVPKIWQDKRLVELSISGILSKPEKAEQVFIECLKEAAKSDNIVLVIEDIHSLARTQTASGLNLLELLVNFLQDHKLMVLGTTSLEDYVDYLHPTQNFDANFTSYELMPLSKADIILACCIRASILEGKNKCFFQYRAIEQSVELTDLYVKGSGQPQKAISILVEAGGRAKSSQDKIITPEIIQKIISEKTHIPSEAFTQNEADKLLNLEEEMSKSIVGQKAALTAVAEGLRRARSGLSEAARPLASFLFVGPTGVGKTEVARVLASNYFGGPSPHSAAPSTLAQEQYLLRLDMSEFRGPDGIIKLLGTSETELDPPLIKHIKNYPFCLLLLDEFEKASPEILNLFLQILEDGRLTSGRGEILDLTHCLIIATSNAGSKDIQTGLKTNKTLDQIKQQLFSLTLVNIFPPELLNRFDGIILFSPLSPEEVKRVTFLQLQSLRQKLLEKGIKADFSENVIADIAKNAFDPSLGARPIRRYIQDHLEGFIAKLILSKQFARGSNVVIDIENGAFTIK